MTTSNPQPRVPHGLGKGDRVRFKLRRDDEDDNPWRVGIIIDILSTQFLIQEDDLTHITHFDNVRPAT